MESFIFCEEEITEISPLWQNYHLQSAGQKIKVKKYYFPILTYGAYTWTATKRDISRFQAVKKFL
jgi:hypothetical protein